MQSIIDYIKNNYKVDNIYVIDFEGYFNQNNSKFFIKEFSHVSLQEMVVHNKFIKTPIIKSKSYVWLVKNFHKIPYNFGDEPYKYVLDVLQKPNTLFLIKGETKKKIIEKLTINKIVNLEEFKCPSLKNLTSNITPYCEFHTHIQQSEHCSYLKLYKILNWLKNQWKIN